MSHPVIERLRLQLERRPPSRVRLPGIELRESAVLVPLVVREGEVRLVVTRRPETMRSHAGQMAFPGGAREDIDVSPLHAALRETEEEVGVAPSSVAVLGQLDETPTLTGFRIIPFVGLLDPRVAYRLCEDEVSELHELSLAALTAPGVHRSEPQFAIGKLWDVDYYDVATPSGVRTIWGATARIVRNLLALTD